MGMRYEVYRILTTRLDDLEQFMKGIGQYIGPGQASKRS